MPLRTLSVKVHPKKAAELQRIAAESDESVSDLLREYVDAVVSGRRLSIVHPTDDSLIGYVVLLEDPS